METIFKGSFEKKLYFLEYLALSMARLTVHPAFSIFSAEKLR